MLSRSCCKSGRMERVSDAEHAMFGRVSGTWKVGRNHLNLMHTSRRVKGVISAMMIQLEGQVKDAALETRWR